MLLGTNTNMEPLLMWSTGAARMHKICRIDDITVLIKK